MSARHFASVSFLESLYARYGNIPDEQ